MWKWIIVQVVAIVLALVAAQVSYSLLQKHVGARPPAWFDEGCPVHAEKGRANCAAVLQSEYGATDLNLPLIGTLRVPVAFLGWAYYSALIIWFLGVGRPTYSRRWYGLIVAAFVAAGLCGSIYFIYVMFAKLDHWCPWCVVTHVLNFLIAVCVILLWPRRPVEAAGAPSKPAPPTPGQPLAPAVRTTIPHPSLRTALVTVAAMVLVAWAEHHMLQSALKSAAVENARLTLDQCMGNLQRLVGDAERLAKIWDVTDTRNIALRPDDPVRNRAPSGQPTWELIIFSDFECPSCKKTATYLEQVVQPMFNHGLRITYRHFPVNKDCNSSIQGTLHPNACLAVGIAEAARLQGGNDAFWRVHDLLFAKQGEGAAGLTGLDPAQIAAAAGLDAKRLAADMQNPVIGQRVNEDIAAAVEAGIRATPHLVVNGRPVDGLAAKEVGFWDKLADRYWKELGVPRPDSTRPKPAAFPAPVTQGTQGPTGGK
jgi:protein-disulfide isomerase/uncharacterized membrane protein